MVKIASSNLAAPMLPDLFVTGVVHRPAPFGVLPAGGGGVGGAGRHFLGDGVLRRPSRLPRARAPIPTLTALVVGPSGGPLSRGGIRIGAPRQTRAEQAAYEEDAAGAVGGRTSSGFTTSE